MSRQRVHLNGCDEKGKDLNPLRATLFALTVLCLFWGLPALGLARPTMLTADTVWSGEVMVADKVVVDANVTLLIRPGTVVCFDKAAEEERKPGGSLLVYGTLIAKGNAEQPILFTSAAQRPAPGDWEGIRFLETRGPPSVLEHCRIEFAERALSGREAEIGVSDSLLLNNRVAVDSEAQFKGRIGSSAMCDNETGIRFVQSGELRVEGCRIAGNAKAGIQCEGASPSIVDNVVENNGKYGIGCFRGSSPRVEGNLIVGNTSGVFAEKKSNPVIRRNDISANDTGVSLDKMAFPLIEGNLIKENRVGIYCNLGTYPTVRRNNILANREYAIDLGLKHAIEVNRKGPFSERDWVFADGGGPLQLRKLDQTSGFSASFPADGRVDARDNWWGEEGVGEMAAKGEGANLDIFEDGHDTPTVEFRGRSYSRDLIAYAPWAKAPFPGAGRRK